MRHTAALGARGMEGLVKKKRIRAGHRSVVTKRIGEVERLLAATEDGERVVRLAQLQLTLKEKLEILKQLDNEVLDFLETEEDISAEIEASDNYNQGVYQALVNIDSSTIGRVSTTPGGGMGTGTGTGLEGGDATPRHSKAKLPKLVLKAFDGDITNWTTFWDTYKSAIHSDSSLSKVDKFTYLQTLLEKTAKEAVSGLALTADNYDQAVSILEKRFGNKQAIIHRHMDILLSVEAVSSSSNHTALRRLYDKVESNVRSLEALGVSADSYGSLLTSVLIKKLPNELRLIMSRKSAGDWELTSMMTILADELEARERSATRHVKDGGRRTSDTPTTAAFVSGDRKAALGCCYCQGEHSPQAWNVVKSTQDRRQILRTTGKCYVCLRVGHLSRNCRSRNRCRLCNRRHHSSICDGSSCQDSRVPDPPPAPSRTQSSSNSNLNPAATPFSGNTTACCCINHKNSVLLQTARAVVFNPAHPERRRSVSILFDSGSQRSYVTEAVSSFLNLESRGQRSMTIMTFGSNKPEQVSCQRVEVGLAKDTAVEIRLISVFTIPMICEPLAQPTAQVALQHLKHLDGLQLSDAGTDDSFQPDLLIGIDHYWSFMTGEYIHLPNGPVAMNTLLGWIVSGPMLGPFEEDPTSLVTHVLRATMSERESNRRLERQLQGFWNLESIGIHDEECSVYEQFSDIVKFREGRCMKFSSHGRIPPSYCQTIINCV